MLHFLTRCAKLIYIRKHMNQNTLNLSNIRNGQGLTQAQVATAIGVSRPTYANIESGKKELTISQAAMLSEIFHVDMNKLIGKELGVSVYTNALDATEKYKQIILNALRYGADDDGKITKTKLAKLVYLVDFTWYYEHSTSMSEMPYRKFPRGPVSDIYFRILDDLEEDGIIIREPRGHAILFSLVEPSAPTDRLEKEELRTIKRICQSWQGKSTSEIVQFTHAQFPWQICHDGEVIPYGLIFQEEPEKIYGPAKL